MRIIVTGGAGFIGSALCRYLVKEVGARILNIDKLTYAANLQSLASISDSDNYDFCKADICDRAALDLAFAEFAPDAVIHLAAESHVDRSITGSDAFMQTNIMGTYTLIEAARAYWDSLDDAARSDFRFLHVSTDEVFGSLGADGLFHEASAYDPGSPYSASKAASDHLAIAWHRTYGFPALISNCSNNYGPCQFPEKLIPLMILSAREGRDLPVYGDGSNVRDWLYVDDHVRALFVILTKGRVGEKYNIGGKNELTNLQVVKHVCDLMDEACPDTSPHKEKISFVSDRPGHDARYAIDASKLETELGWKAKEDFSSGIEKTVYWYLENPAWWAPLLQKNDLGKRLGLTGDAVVAKDRH